MDLKKFIKEKQIIVCCGSGGVGKTTISATIALQGAIMGKKAIVCTIDPAKRLANSLGLHALGNDETLVSPTKFDEVGLKVKGELYAMMLDNKRTFDDLVEKYAPTEEIRDAIFNNTYYQQFSGALAGSQEYMAMEKLYELYQKGVYDLIVLDTPPTRHALEFLDAPKRLTDFLDDSTLQWFIKPYFAVGKLGFNILKRATAKGFTILERITGLQVLKDISDFILSFSGMYDGFKQRASKVNELFRDEHVVFFLVNSTDQPSIEEAKYFYKRLKEGEMPFGGFIINKVHLDSDGLRQDFEKKEEFLSSILEVIPVEKREGWTPTIKKMIENYEKFLILSKRDLLCIKELKAIDNGKNNLKLIPHLERDIYDIDGLMAMNQQLFENPDLNI